MRRATVPASRRSRRLILRGSRVRSSATGTLPVPLRCGARVLPRGDDRYARGGEELGDEHFTFEPGQGVWAQCAPDGHDAGDYWCGPESYANAVALGDDLGIVGWQPQCPSTGDGCRHRIGSGGEDSHAVDGLSLIEVVVHGGHFDRAGNRVDGGYKDARRQMHGSRPCECASSRTLGDATRPGQVAQPGSRAGAQPEASVGLGR